MNDVIVREKIIIENLIYEVRGKQVMLDSDLAKLYEVETKRINEAVKNNPDKFPERFSWFLTENDIPGKGHYRKYLPRAFTEQGVAMLATILKSKIATETSIRIMDAFVLMKRYISSSLIEQKYINDLVLEDHNKIKKLEITFQKFEEKRKVNEIYFDGQIYDAYSKIQDIFKTATKKIIIIDAYADNTLLDIVKRLNLEVIIVTKKENLLTHQDITKYNKQYHNLRVIFNNSFHDRYFIIDDKDVYHCGASINRIGYKTFSINLISDEEVCNSLINKVNKIL